MKVNWLVAFRAGLILLGCTWMVGLLMPIPKPVTETLGSFWSYLLAKSLHLGVFAFLGFGVRFGWRPHKQKQKNGLLILYFLAALSELLQFVMSDWCHRSGTVRDVLIDSIGISLGWFLAVGLEKKWLAGYTQESTSAEKPRERTFDPSGN